MPKMQEQFSANAMDGVYAENAGQFSASAMAGVYAENAGSVFYQPAFGQRRAKNPTTIIVRAEMTFPAPR